MKAAHELALVGGHPALDFANTVGWHAGDAPLESLGSYDDLLRWAEHAKVVDRRQATRLRAAATRHPRRAIAALADARRVRELIYRAFTAVARGTAPSPQDLTRLHEARILALTSGSPGWHDGLVVTTGASDDLLAPVHGLVLAAAELLKSPELGRVRQCANDPCGWLFLDRSRNGSRRWCSSTDCGNEHRVRQFRARHR